MLKFLRKKGVMKKILWVIAIIIILSFGVFGTATSLSRRNTAANYAGIIFNRKVSFREFENAYLHARQQAVLRYGENFQKIQQFIDLEAEAWDRLILVQEAKKRKIRVSDPEVIQTIQELPFFKTNGTFDQEVYQRLLRYVFQSFPRDFEEGIRESILFQKLYEQETFLTDVTEEELQEIYQKENEKVQISYVLWANDDYTKDVQISPAQAEEFYAQNKESFRRPETINVEYLALEFPANATQEQENTISVQADKINEDLKNSLDLKTIAEKYQLQVKESGFFSQEQPPTNLGWSFNVLKKIFTMSVGETSPMIKTSNGYCTLKVKEKRDSYLPDFSEIVSEVEQSLKIKEAQKIAKAKAEENRLKIQEILQTNPEKDFAAIIKEMNLSSQQTPVFNRGQYLPGIGISKEFQEAAFALKEKGEISSVVETPKGYCLLHLDSYSAIDAEKYEKEKEGFRKTLLDLKKSQSFSQFIAKLRIKANLKSHLPKAQKNPTDEEPQVN